MFPDGGKTHRRERKGQGDRTGRPYYSKCCSV